MQVNGFWTGYSSLHYLKSCPIETVNINKWILTEVLDHKMDFWLNIYIFTHLHLIYKGIYKI